MKTKSGSDYSKPPAHLKNSEGHIHYQTFADIDAIATSPKMAEQLSTDFGYRFIQVSRRDKYPRYKLGKSASHLEVIQLLEMNIEAGAKAFKINRFAPAFPRL